MRLVDADKLKEDMVSGCRRIGGAMGVVLPTLAFVDIIDKAPTEEFTFEEAFKRTVCEHCDKNAIPQGEREFIEILAQNVPKDLCTYPEYKGKPYYSIHYKENGEDFVGFGTYKPEVLSRYLRDYFMRDGGRQ
jgi:hypothetical protein